MPSPEPNKHTVVQRKARVVVADDDDDCRGLVVDALRRDGFEVFEAKDGEQLIRRVAALRGMGHVVNAVVSDIGMPNCDGLRATRSLRSTSRHLPIVLMTGFGDPELLHDALQAGATALLRKPIRSDELSSTLRKALAW
jgi:two-component system response regulator (stage 0 sporulation protein F)